MRSDGASVPKIVEALAVPKGTVFNWVKDIVLTPDQIKAIKRQPGSANGSIALKNKYQAIRDQYRKIGAEKGKHASPLMIAGCMLYWGEGSKAVNEVSFTNTDRDMVELFARFLREELMVTNEKIKVAVVVHDGYGNKNKEECAAHWALATGCIGNVTVRHPKDKRPINRKNRHPHGICILRVYDVTVVQMLYGALEAIVGKPMTFPK